MSAGTGKVQAAQADGNIRVLLMDTDYATYEHPSVTVIQDGIETTYTPQSPELSQGTFLLEGGTEGITVTSIVRRDGCPTYPGTLELTSTGQGILLINELPLEEYLKAVVSSEMPSSYSMEAQKAQAVCARTYAWRQMEEGKLSGYGADVDDSVSFQVYQNVFPTEASAAAVEETAGKILCKDGEPIQAYYFSTSSGVTSTDEIWGAEPAADYLKSVACDFDSQEPWSQWSVEIPWENLDAAARSLLPEGGALTALEIRKKSESGAVTGLTVIMENGSVEVENEYNVREFLSPSGCVITEKDGSQTVGGRLLPSAYFSLEYTAGDSILLQGGGYGHGVGMSQNAANEMGKMGYTFEEILDYFFQDVEIELLASMGDS
ncbi:MAG: SpoIID/LytB domain-containing protein [Clostridiales bacterium]|nr:SpoIID/LytB domain-containing protein [Clostridiales bacterium]